MSENNQNETSTVKCLAQMGRGKTCGLPSVGNGLCKEHHSLWIMQEDRKNQEDARKKQEEEKKRIELSQLKTQSDTEYLKMKDEFEILNCIVGDYIFSWHQDLESYDILNKKRASDKYSDLKYNEVNKKGEIEEKSFFTRWFSDKKYPAKRYRDGVGFDPSKKEILGKYNMFRGFEAEKHNFELEPYEIEENVKPILKHLDFLTSGNSYWMIQWLGDVIQNPGVKSEVANLIRDMGDLLLEGGGTGKNAFFDWFGNHILGKANYLRVSNNDLMYDKFNARFSSRLLIFIEEAGGGVNHQYYDRLKAMISSDTQTIEKKGIDAKDVKDCARWVFCSNNKLPVAIKQGDRRFTAFDVNSIMRNNRDYFTKFYAHIKKDEVKYSFFTYLKHLNLAYKAPIDFQTNRPITETYAELRLLNAPLYHKWLVHCIKNEEIKEDTYYLTSSLYSSFINWCCVNNETKSDKVMSQTYFSSLLTDAKGLFKDKKPETDNFEILPTGSKIKSHGNMKYKFDLEYLKKGLINLHLLKEDKPKTTKINQSGFIGVRAYLLESSFKKIEDKKALEKFNKEKELEEERMKLQDIIRQQKIDESMEYVNECEELGEFK
jgi:hypothetical protein